jgi:broad specificity phosphatase PhoE
MSSPRLPLFAEVPASLTLVRHAESLGNVADRTAREADADRLDLDVRDADVDLSDNGKEQADVLARWFASITEDLRPTLVLTSPFQRAAETARRTIADTGLEIVVDERLRERDLGVFDGLTGRGIRAQYADEASRRKKVGKFYYQPPSGESWADVVLRVRSLLADLRTGYADSRIWVFSHQAVIMSFRYVLEGITEQDLLELDSSVTIGNASITTYERRGDDLELAEFADDSVVRRGEATATREATVAEEAERPA